MCDRSRRRALSPRLSHSLNNATHIRSLNMDPTGCLTTDRIRAIFAEEIDSRGGIVQKVHADGGNLYCRATLPLAEEVAAGDRVRGGAALRATPACACICPWLLRILCINGIIVRQPMPEREVEI